MARRSSRGANISARYFAIGLVFGIVCLICVIVVAFYQIRGSALPPIDDGMTRSYTVPGLRGEIYDCNGTLLVGNSTSYDLIYEYGAMPDTRKEVNSSLLEIKSAVLRTGNGDKLAKDYFVLEGTYPDMSFSSAVSDKDSAEYYYYQRFLDRQEMDEEDTEAKDIVKYFVKRYKLLESIYSNDEITELIRIYYDMERVDFGAYASYTVASDINIDLITYLEESNIEGANFDIRAERKYCYPGVASHILGRLGKITAENADQYIALNYPLDALVGTSGCEEAFEEWLHGTDGTMVLKFDKDGNVVEKYYETEPVHGKDVYLTLDIDIQLAAEQGLAEGVALADPSEAGAITVLDPNTGKILAMASYPTYDLTQFGKQEYYDSLLENDALPLFNRALDGVYSPGSTYKVGVALAALETGSINKSIEYYCDGVYGDSPNGPTCLDSHHSLDVVGAIRESCNIFFYNLGDLMGIEAMTGYTRRFGLGVPTGIELPEANGRIADPSAREDWSLGNDRSAAIGQSDHGYTPLQLSVYMSTVVNRGKRYGAHLLDSVKTQYTNVPEKKYEPYIIDEVDFQEETYDLLIEAMRQVVESNPTLQQYFTDVPVTVGGKTGTVEVDGKTDYAVFCGFAPLESPQIVASCVLEEGKFGVRAAYAVSRVMEAYFEKQVALSGSIE